MSLRSRFTGSYLNKRVLLLLFTTGKHIYYEFVLNCVGDVSVCQHRTLHRVFLYIMLLMFVKCLCRVRIAWEWGDQRMYLLPYLKRKPATHEVRFVNIDLETQN